MIQLTSLMITLALYPSLLGGAGAVCQKSSEVILPEGTRIALHLNDHLSTKQNSEGNDFTATVVNPVNLGDREVLPKGSIVTASVSRVVRPGRFRGKATMTVMFHSIRIPSKKELPLSASLVVIGMATIFSTRGQDLEIPPGSILNVILDRPLGVPFEPESNFVKQH
jgi:hypothetical protein